MKRLPAVFLYLVSILVAAASSPAAAPPPDVVLYASTAPVRAGAWTVVSDATAAGGAALKNPDAGAAKVATAAASPATYFELTFDAVAGQPYHLWIRGKAQNNSWANDSVYVQFSDAVAGSTPQFAIGTTSGLSVSIEDCSGCGLSGWGWQDNTYAGLAPNITFATSSTHTIRVQPREDGLTIDQIVLSASTYLSSAPGGLKNDNTIVPDGSGTPPPPPPPATLVRQPFLQQMGSDGVTVVWATRELQSGAVVASAGTSAPVTYPASSTAFPATVTGMASDYYQYEATLSGLQPSTAYSYRLQMNGADLTDGLDHFTTAPPAGTGTVRFIAFGDSGTGSSEQVTLAGRMIADRFDLALHTGDIVYGNSGGTGAATYAGYQAWFFDIYRDWLRNRPMFTTIGNHDNATANAKPYRDVYVLPTNGASTAYPDHAERFYSFDYGPVHFVSLDTELAFLDTSRRQAQLDWLTADLASTTQHWKVVFFHRPGYSSGSEHGSDLTIRNAFGPIFEQYGVQLVLNGHDHDYERTVPIRTSTDPSRQAVTYIVTGGGGAPSYTVGTSSWTAFSRSATHYVRAEASDCHIVVEAVGADAAVFDTVTLDRCGTTAPPPSSEIVVYAADVPASNISGTEWTRAADASAAGGFVVKDIDRARAKGAALASPSSYVDLPFSAQAGTAYQVWFRMKAQNNSYNNDSIYAQFSGAANASGQPLYRIGTTAAASIILEDKSGAGVAGWGWTDSAYGSLAAPIYFASSGPQTVRIQTREDGVSIDQIVISSAKYLTTPPGAAKNDTTIVPRP